MDEKQLQLQIILLVLAAMQGDQLANQLILQIMQAAQLGDLQATLIAQMIQQVALQMQQLQARMAKFGAKLNYIKQLRGGCPDGYSAEYYRQGGRICQRCKKNQEGGNMMLQSSSIKDLFISAKCGKKLKKKEEGGSIESAKCGGKPKLRKKACGSPVKKAACGGKAKKKK